MYSEYEKQRIIHFYMLGYKAPTITLHVLEDVSTCSSPATPCKTGTIRRKPGKTKIDKHVKAIVDQQMQVDDETTTCQLHKLLCTQKYRINRRTILRCRSSLGWTLRGSAYCQLIRNVNKQKRLAWAQQNANDTFDAVIWTDECTVQLDCHRRFCCRKRGEAPRLNQGKVGITIVKIRDFRYLY